MTSNEKSQTPSKWKTYDYAKLYELNEIVGQNIELILDYFLVDCKKSGRRYVGACPVHGGDNCSAFNVRENDWVCYTHKCQDHFKKTFIGLIRGILSHRDGWAAKGDNQVGFESTIKWILDFLKVDIDKCSRYNIETLKLTQQNNTLNLKRKDMKPILSRDKIRAKLDIPAEYLLNRGYSKELLNDYDIGLCREQYKPMSNRVVIPIYDDTHSGYIGCLGRSVLEPCEKCKHYHINNCPKSEDLFKYRKWTNSEGFHRDSYLFNYWKAKKFIDQSRTAVLVEGPLDCLRLEQNGIHNSLALFGSTLTDAQGIILEKHMIDHLVLLLDNDESGKAGKDAIASNYKNMFRIHLPSFNAKDPGECSIEEIKNLKDLIEKL